jgi:hypothetical protein
LPGGWRKIPYPDRWAGNMSGTGIGEYFLRAGVARRICQEAGGRYRIPIGEKTGHLQEQEYFMRAK